MPNKVFRNSKTKLKLCSKQAMRLCETDDVICFSQSHGLLQSTSFGLLCRNTLFKATLMWSPFTIAVASLGLTTGYSNVQFPITSMKCIVSNNLCGVVCFNQSVLYSALMKIQIYMLVSPKGPIGFPTGLRFKYLFQFLNHVNHCKNYFISQIKIYHFYCPQKCQLR